MDPKISQTIGWIMAEIDAIERVLRRLAPGIHISNGDLITEAQGSAQIQRAPKDPQAGRAWAGLPAISRAVGAPPLVAPSRPFAATLAGSEPLPPILAPLSHGHGLEAPKGIVSGIARPTSTVAGPPIPAPVQRSPLGTRRARTAALDATFAEADAAAMEPLPATASPEPHAIATPDPAAVPIRKLAAATAAPPARALTRAAEPARPAPVGLVGQPRAAGRAPAVMSKPAAPTVQRSPEPSAPTRATPAAPSAAARTAEPAGGAPRLTIGQARRLGLGAPVAGGPVMGSTRAFRDVAAAQRSPATTAPSAAATSPTQDPGIQHAPEPSPPDMPLASRPAQTAGEVAGARPAALGPSAPIAADAAPAPAIARPIADTIERPVVHAGSPIISARPLHVRVQRAPLTLPMPAAASGGSAGAGSPVPATAGGPVSIHRDGEASQLSTALDARSFTHGGEIFLPASHGPLTTGTGKALLAHELTHVTQQRRLGSSLPGEETPHGKSLEAEAVAAERSPHMLLAAAPPGGPAATSSAGPAIAPVPTAPAQSPGPQRAPAGGGGSPGPQTPGAGSSSSGGASGHSHSEQELEVLAHQLYHRIGRHLRRELLVDRERIGFALDLP